MPVKVVTDLGRVFSPAVRGPSHSQRPAALHILIFLGNGCLPINPFHNFGSIALLCRLSKYRPSLFA
eukprot:11773093-Prorocentrum_lima.AAC.1